jgi:hypothetical protein
VRRDLGRYLGEYLGTTLRMGGSGGHGEGLYADHSAAGSLRRATGLDDSLGAPHASTAAWTAARGPGGAHSASGGGPPLGATAHYGEALADGLRGGMVGAGGHVTYSVAPERGRGTSAPPARRPLYGAAPHYSPGFYSPDPFDPASYGGMRHELRPVALFEGLCGGHDRPPGTAPRVLMDFASPDPGARGAAGQAGGATGGSGLGSASGLSSPDGPYHVYVHHPAAAGGPHAHGGGGGQAAGARAHAGAAGGHGHGHGHVHVHARGPARLAMPAALTAAYSPEADDAGPAGWPEEEWGEELVTPDGQGVGPPVSAHHPPWAPEFSPEKQPLPE